MRSMDSALRPLLDGTAATEVQVMSTSICCSIAGRIFCWSCFLPKTKDLCAAALVRPASRQCCAMFTHSLQSRPWPSLPQVSASVLSADEAHDPDVLSINAASAALACSDVAWAGPIGAVRMTVPVGGSAPIVNATREQEAAAALSALVVGTENRILHIEAEVKSGSHLPRQFWCVGLAIAEQHSEPIL